MKKIMILMIALNVVLMAWDKAVVTSVTDGDTLWIEKENSIKSVKVRLIGVDTFETKINHRTFKQLALLKELYPKDSHDIREVLSIGHKTKEYVIKDVLKKEIEYNSYGFDKYGRELIYIKNLTYHLVRLGYSKVFMGYKMHKSRRDFLLEANRLAKEEGVGIYAEKK